MNQFDRDIENHGQYIYTRPELLSARLANIRNTRAIISIAQPAHTNILDIGCGDGTFTADLARIWPHSNILGIDISASAIHRAQDTYFLPNLKFQFLHHAHTLPFDTNRFNLAILRGTLHHARSPRLIFYESTRVASNVVLLEPNGNSPVLKFIEHWSSYHRDHNEMSFSPATFTRWARSTDATLINHAYAGLVPTFCSDRWAWTLSLLEPLAEHLPFFRRYLCRVYLAYFSKLIPKE